MRNCDRKGELQESIEGETSKPSGCTRWDEARDLLRHFHYSTTFWSQRMQPLGLTLVFEQPETR